MSAERYCPVIANSLYQRIRCVGMPPNGLVVAISGGPDSVALARAVAVVRPSGSLLVLAHLNHQLRGADSDADEAFVTQLHEQLAAADARVKLAKHRLDIRSLASQESANLEAVARRERYRWLAEVAQQHGLSHVATGHTASDQAETVLHRILRGTGIDGLCGIAERRHITPDVQVLRPLLLVTRAEILVYLKELGQEARHDSSNDDCQLTRNRIRHELLPLLERDYNPKVAEVLCRLATQAQEISQAEELQGQDLLQRAELPRAGHTIILDAHLLASSERRLVRGVFRLLWQRENWPRGEMGFVEYDRLAELASRPRGAWDLPGGLHAQRRGRVIQLSVKKPEPRDPN